MAIWLERDIVGTWGRLFVRICEGFCGGVR